MCVLVCVFLGGVLPNLMQGSELNKNIEQIFFLIKKEIYSFSLKYPLYCKNSYY